MKGLRNGVIIVGLCFLADRIAASTVQKGKRSSEDKLQRLKEDIKYYNEYQERKSSQKYTMLCITGENFSFQKICQIYDELIEKDDPNKMLSVISFISMNGNEPYDPQWFMQRLIKNMQECLNQGKNHILRDGLSLNIDFIKRKYINDFDQVKSKLELICDIYRRFEESMMDHFYDICLDALKSIMYDSIIKRIQENVKYRSLQERIDGNRMDDFCKDEFALIIQMVETSDFWYEIKHTSAWDFSDKESAYYMLYFKALRYEEELRFYYSSLYIEDLHAMYTYIIHEKYKKLFLGGIKDVFEKCLPVFKKQVNQKSFSKHYTAICKNLVIFLKKSRLSENYDFSCRISGFFRTRNFTANIQSWFTDLVSNDLKKEHCKKYIVSLDKMRTKPRSWYVTKLVCNGQIDKVKMHQLCDILYHNMTFDRLHKHQAIYIDHEKGMSEIRAGACTKDLGKEIKKFTANAKTLHFSTVIEPIHESPKQTPQKIFTYTEEIMDTNDKFDQSCVTLRRKNEEKKITFGRYDETEMQNSESTQHLITMCVTNNNSTPIDTSIVKIVTNDTFSYIVIFQHRAKKSKRRKIVSLIFNMHSLGPGITNVIEKDQDRRIRCLDNVPLSFRNNFFDFLEYLELSDSISFELPNILPLSTIDLIYTEHIVCMHESENEFRLHRKLSDVYKPDYLRTETFCLSAEKILNFERVQSHNHEKLKMCIKDIGVTENEFNEILKEVIFNKRIINVHNITGSINSEDFQSSKFDIYITYHKGDKKLLHILESSGSCFMHNMAVNPIEDISFIFGLEDRFTALQKLNSVAKCLDENVSFLSLVMIEICKHMKYTTKSHPFGSRGLNRSQFRTIIYQNIGKVFKRIKYCSEDIKNPKRNYFAEIYKTLPDIQAEIVPKDLEELAEILFIKSNTIPIEKRYKVVSIKIKRRTDDNETRSNTTYQYEDVRRWW